MQSASTHQGAPMYTTLISVAQLHTLMASDSPHMVFDCSFELMQPETGDAQ